MHHAARSVAVAAVAFATLSFAQQATSEAAAEPAPYKWARGPGDFDLGRDLAGVELGETEVFLGGEEAQKLLSESGNQISGTELGIVAPASDDENWFMVFEYDDVGYVKDDEKDSIDADALLASIKEGTEEANKYRAERGLPGLHVVGWHEQPHYDDKSHNLVWALLARNDNGREIVNYNVRLLGRGGYMSVTLVEDPESLAATRPAFDAILARFAYKPGKTYAEFKSGDKVSQYGLTALVAAGAGAAAVKLGFFAILAKFFSKAGKALILGVLAIGAFLSKIFKAMLGKKDEVVDTGIPPPPPSP